jgi:alkaline phosphatase D
VIDYKTTDILDTLTSKGQIYSLVVDNVGTPANLYKTSSSFLLPKGKFIQIGVTPSIGGIKMVGGNMLIPGFLGGGRNSYSMLMAKPSKDALSQVGEWMKEGKVRGVVDSVFEWEDAPQAFEKLKTGRAKGKVVVRVPQDKAKEKA